MRGKLVLTGVIAALVATTAAHAADANVPQDSNGQATSQQPAIPAPTTPKIKKNSALLPGIGGLLALGAGGVAAAGGSGNPVSP